MNDDYGTIRDRAERRAMLEAQRLSALCAAYNSAPLNDLRLDGLAVAIRSLAINIAHQINGGGDELTILLKAIAGSDAPPPDAEIQQVIEAGGFWMHYTEKVGVPLVERSVQAMITCAEDQREKGYTARWWAFTATGELWVRR